MLPVPLPELVDQICVEQRTRWLRGDCVPAEDILADYPRVAEDFEAAFDVIYNEYLIREELADGEEVAIEDFCQRFPRYGERLQRQLRFRSALSSNFDAIFPVSSAAGESMAGGESSSGKSSAAVCSQLPAPPPEYSVLRCLGSGASGTVYEATDHRRQDRIALKTLHRHLAPWTGQLKNEFRTLAALDHGNLVQLYELFEHAGHYWIAMELVDGTDAVSALRADLRDTARFHERVRRFMLQLADALDFLQQHGILHCDIKPANLLWTPAGRAVLLDFGLARSFLEGRHEGVQRSHMRGTLAYVAPEVLLRRPAGPPCDWYSLGVTLYEMLTGQLPFTGTAGQICHEKTAGRPVSPLELVPGTDPLLSQLCMELLEPQPERRAGAGRTLALLASTDSSDIPHCSPREQSGPAIWHETPLSGGATSSPFVGRDREQAQLHAAFQRAESGPVCVLVAGESGIGKSAFVENVLEQLEAADRPLVLSGRCYRNESIPFKAMDWVIERLGRHLHRLTGEQRQELLVENRDVLARMFPALGRLMGESYAEDNTVPEAPELREQGFAALCDILRQLSASLRLVIHIDDLQWGDTDSAQLLSHVLHAPQAPPLLVIGAYRTEAENSPFLSSFLSRWDRSSSPAELVRLRLSPLGADEAETLARLSLQETLSEQDGQDAEFVSRLAPRVVEQSGGNPYLLREYATLLAAAPRQTTEGKPQNLLADALRIRTGNLPASARTLLELVALTSRPATVEALMQASGTPAEIRSALRLLEHRRLIRYRFSEHGFPVDTYHDQVRETLLPRISAERARQHHQRLAEVYLSAAGRDAELAATHLMAAGQPQQAYPLALEAAERARQTLAFEHRVNSLKLALDCEVVRGRERITLMQQYADALARDGKGHEAAEVYLQAAEAADPAEKRELQRMAGIHLTEFGDPGRGMQLLEQSLIPEGITIPASPRRALVRALWHDFRLQRRGTGFTVREKSSIPPRQLEKLIAWQSVFRLTTGRVIERISLLPEFAMAALDAGELESIGIALGNLVGFLWWQGERSQRRIAEYVELAESRVLAQTSPATQALFRGAQSLVSLAASQWQETERFSDEALRLCTLQPEPVQGLMSVTRMYSVWAKYFLGQFPELSETIPRLIFQSENDARDTSGHFRISYCNAIWLVADQPDVARSHLERAASEWQHRLASIDLAHEAIARLNLALYERDQAAAEALLADRWKQLRRNGVFRVPLVRVVLRGFRGSIHLMHPSSERNTSRAVRRALHDARKLDSEGNPLADIQAAMLRAQCAHRTGDRTAAISSLQQAASRCDRLHMKVYAAVVRRAHGRLLGGAQGDQLTEEAEAVCSEQGIRNINRFTAMLMPGFAE